MRIVVISDIHGNQEALSALPEEYDELWVLGDLVNYGPHPREVIEFVRSRAAAVVRGNHDHAIGYGVSPRCSPRFRQMAECMQEFSVKALNFHDRLYLRRLPLQLSLRRDRTLFRLCHAVPSDPFYPYLAPDADRWVIECTGLDADVLLVGHTHVPFMRQVNQCLVVNPGSLGQPKHGKPEACYALWDNGSIELRSFTYPFEDCVRAIERLELPEPVKNDLAEVLRTGAPPAKESQPGAPSATDWWI
jgi:putative phosphoesterase